MKNLNDVLLAMSNIPVVDPIAEIWGRGLQGGGYTIIEYTGALPITINANGEPLIDYRIYGNTVHTGTPTPENPIMPIGCGELETTGAHAGQYKLPILSNSTVTNIYLGEVETTRRIKKLVLTGEENWVKRTFGNRKHTFEHAQIFRLIGGQCSHYANYTAADIDMVDGVYLSNTFRIIITDLRFTAVTDFMDYLAAQHTAGTPVTVWCILTEPETGIVNEPLMKIGNYADTIDSTQTTAQIPTSKGTNIIDYDGTPKPSQMYIKYLGR